MLLPLQLVFLSLLPPLLLALLTLLALVPLSCVVRLATQLAAQELPHELTDAPPADTHSVVTIVEIVATRGGKHSGGIVEVRDVLLRLLFGDKQALDAPSGAFISRPHELMACSQRAVPSTGCNFGPFFALYAYALAF